MTDDMSNKQNPEILGYIGAKPGGKKRESDEWFTPSVFIEKARSVLESIDLDPFSSEEANKVVKATRYFSLENSAMEQDWLLGGKEKVTVWMNPPYGRSTLSPAIRAFSNSWKKKQISQAIVLVNNATETRWFQELLTMCSAICLVRGRISFYNTDGKEISGNTRGQVFIYFGRNKQSFKSVFKEIGTIGVISK